jgi:hypothetical protein
MLGMWHVYMLYRENGTVLSEALPILFSLKYNLSHRTYVLKVIGQINDDSASLNK